MIHRATILGTKEIASHCKIPEIMNISVKEPVYIIIPVHNRKNITLKCLETLSQTGDLQRYHVIVVDDGSTDGTTEAINSLYPKVTILAGDGNLWWTGAIKKGMEYAYEQGAEYFVWLNDDCLVTEQAIPDLVEFCRQSNLNIAGCQGYELDNPTQIAFGGKYKNWHDYQLIKFSENEIKQCDLLSGNLVVFSKELIKKIGFPNPRVLPHYGGDALFLIHARKAGFKIFVDTSNKVFNLHGIPSLAPSNWLLKEGEPLDILRLIFVRQSCLSWKKFFCLLKAEYSVSSILIFLINYCGFILPKIVVITLLRYLPLKARYCIYASKVSLQKPSRI